MNALLVPIFVTLHVYGVLAYIPSPHLFARLPQSVYSPFLDNSDDSITVDDFAKTLISLPSAKRSEVYDALLSVLPFMEPGSNVYSFLDSLPNAVRDQARLIQNPYRSSAPQRSPYAPFFGSPNGQFASLLGPLLAGAHSQPHRHRKSPTKTCHRRHRIISPTHGIDLDFSIISTLESDDEADDDGSKPENSNESDTENKPSPEQEPIIGEKDKSEDDGQAAKPAQDNAIIDDQSKLEKEPEQAAAANEEASRVNQSQEDAPIAPQPTIEPNRPEEQLSPAAEVEAVIPPSGSTENQVESETSGENATRVIKNSTASPKRPRKVQGKRRNSVNDQTNAAASAEDTATEPAPLQFPSPIRDEAAAGFVDTVASGETKEVDDIKSQSEENPKSEETAETGKPKRATLKKVPRKRPAPKVQ